MRKNEGCQGEKLIQLRKLEMWQYQDMLEAYADQVAARELELILSRRKDKAS